MLQSMQIQQVKQMPQTKQDTLQWFYEQAKEYKLTGTAQRLWYWLFTQFSMAPPDRFYEISSRTLANKLGVCLKSIERSRKALQQSGLLHYEVRGKSVYYRMLLPVWNDCAQNDATTIPQQIAELTAKLEEYAQQIAQLQAQLACHFNQSGEIPIAEHENKGSLDYARDDLQEGSLDYAQDDVQEGALGYARDDCISPAVSIIKNNTAITNSKDYTALKQKQQHQPDILFNDKYEIFLWDYLNKYKDNRFAEACYNHFIMLKEIYQQKGKKKLTAEGFQNIMNELEQLSGNDMTLKLAIMERSLRNRWAGFFALPDNTPEHKKTEKKKQGRKRNSYRNGSGRSQYRSYYDSFQPREGRDLEYLVQ